MLTEQFVVCSAILPIHEVDAMNESNELTSAAVSACPPLFWITLEGVPDLNMTLCDILRQSPSGGSQYKVSLLWQSRTMRPERDLQLLAPNCEEEYA